MQYSSSEKICAPIIFDKNIFKLNMNGNSKNRTTTVNLIIGKANKKIVLGGNYTDFERWLQYEYLN